MPTAHVTSPVEGLIAAFSEAIRLDPNYALAFAHRSFALSSVAEEFEAGRSAQIADFDRAQTLSGAVLTSPNAFHPPPFEFYGRQRDGWHMLTTHPTVTGRPLGDVRMTAARAIRGAGFHYVLADNGNGGNGFLGAAMLGHEAEWGLEKAADYGPIVLFRIK